MIDIVIGDITKVSSDAIITPATPSLTAYGEISKRIHRVASPRLLNECRSLPITDGIRCHPGYARITQAYDLPAKWVVHAVPPTNNSAIPEPTLANAYCSAFMLTTLMNAKTVTVAALTPSTSHETMMANAAIALNCCRKFSDSLTITIVLPDQQSFDIWFEKLIEDFDWVA